ncbi:DM13 domain-containing protein [Merismopedia glauca]|uniref:Electron transfer protein with DM13 domain protein n=1 Tax=Merismopedia glauca CCAP 1448/3 TaxID=1296344 RepID=A0A2T1BXW8_9CYAN|nr:DM13 domain-containing protein [Merismopedia glauca]PSB00774.1 electron transfer protein with DM13 domain protein [Merismopedia glauca CCAP 1448/3]
MKLKYISIFSVVCLVAIALASQLNYQANLAVLETKSLAREAPIKTLAKSQNQGRIKSGTFVSGEASTAGTVRLVTQNGKSSLQLESNFNSSTGPDLVVILHKSPNILGSTQPPNYPLPDSNYVILAPLKRSKGAQSYNIPSNINLGAYKSVAIWCRRYNATFGAAVLN